MNLALFDIDGTLLNADFDYECYLEALKTGAGINISRDDFNWDNYNDVTDLGITRDVLREFYKREPYSEEIENVRKDYINNLYESSVKTPDKIKPVPGSMMALDIFNKENWKAGIATGCFSGSAEIKLNAAGIVIKNLVISDSDEYISKIDIIRDAVTKIKKKENTCAFGKIIYFGDRKYDYFISRKLDIDFIGIDSNNSGELQCLGVKNILADFEDKRLMEYLH